MTRDTSASLVSITKGGRLRIEVDRYVRNDDGSSRRVRFRRLMPANTSRVEAEALAAKMTHEMCVKSALVKTADGWDNYIAGLSIAPKSWLYATMKNMEQRAKIRGIECSLSIQQLRDVLLRSRGRCELTGLRFTREWVGGARTRPYFHSVDRIDSAKGYTLDNVRVVCFAANIAMNAWGEEVFAELARGLVFNRYSALYRVEK
jgi:hypothetical protein